jgi:hypothetical protein
MDYRTPQFMTAVLIYLAHLSANRRSVHHSLWTKLKESLRPTVRKHLLHNPPMKLVSSLNIHVEPLNPLVPPHMYF